MSTFRSIASLAGWLLLSFSAAVIGSAASWREPNFYRELRLPEFAPPGWVFGPVWSTLYFLMGVSAWLVWRERERANVKGALGLFVAQLAANALWSWLFFAWRLGIGSFVEIVILWGLIMATAVAFWRVRPVAGILLLPYIAWVSFATVLNFTIWRMNPELLG